MKYIKKFEIVADFLFNKGDKVKLDTLVSSYKNRIYLITQKDYNSEDDWNSYYLRSDDNDKIGFWEYEQNLKKATQKEIEDYQIKIIAKKYNL